MLRYFSKRLLLAIPTLILVSLIAFYLKRISPGDPVEAKMGFRIDEQYAVDRAFLRSSYELTAREFHLDEPAFYFSVHPHSLPAQYHREIYPERRQWLQRCSRQTGRGMECDRLREQLVRLQSETFAHHMPSASTARLFTEPFDRLPAQLEKIYREAESIDTAPEIRELGEETMVMWKDLDGERTLWRNFVPVFRWHGLDNQYHHWISDFLRGDYGISMADGRPIGAKVREAARWTLSINAIALVLIFALGIPIGLFLAVRKDRWDARTVSLIVYSLYAFPLFWIATLAVVFLTTDAYGAWTNWFPAVGNYQVPERPGFFGYFGFAATRLILPILCIVIASIAYISIQMRNNMEKAFETKYFLAAASRGLPKQVLIRRHALPNALYSMVSILSQAIPALIGGSVVIELIFNISGMGRLMWSGLFGEDYELVIAIVMLGAIFTVAGQLIADLIYVILNPKVRFSKSD